MSKYWNIETLRAILAGWNEEIQWNYWQYGYVENIQGLGKVHVVDRAVPNEESWNPYIIFQVEDLDGQTSFWRKNGSFYSYDGVIWAGRFEKVKAKTKTVIEYEYVLDD